MCDVSHSCPLCISTVDLRQDEKHMGKLGGLEKGEEPLTPGSSGKLLPAGKQEQKHYLQLLQTFLASLLATSPEARLQEMGTD